MKNFKFQVGLAIVCVVLGLMLAIQFRAVQKGVGPVTEYRARELAAQLKKLKDERDTLMNIKSVYENKIRDFENAESQGSNAAKLLKDQLDNARVMAGLADVEGPGIIVTLNDLGFGEKYNYALISYSMLLEVINNLNAAGAEAISINGQRIVATTEIIEAGLHININTQEFAPPYEIKAIGEPTTMETALRMRGGIVSSLENENIYVEIEPQKNIQIKKYDGVIERKYIKVLKEGEAQ